MGVSVVKTTQVVMVKWEPSQAIPVSVEPCQWLITLVNSECLVCNEDSLAACPDNLSTPCNNSNKLATKLATTSETLNSTKMLVSTASTKLVTATTTSATP